MIDEKFYSCAWESKEKYELNSFDEDDKEATNWEIYEEEKRVKCIYCKKPIHIDRFAGVNKEFHEVWWFFPSNDSIEIIKPEKSMYLG